MNHCEICATNEHLLFRYSTEDLYREHLELVHGIVLDEDGRAVKQSPTPSDPKPEPAIVTPKPRR